MHHSDPELIKACQSGDQDAWNRLVDQYGRLVYSIPKRLGFSESDSDDIFAAVWATAYKNLGRLRDRTRVSAWLITTAHRECWRLNRKRSASAGGDIAEISEEPSSDLAERWDLQHTVRMALKRLGGRCEELLTALFLEPGESRYDVIAERLNMPVGSIGPTRARCFGKLEQILSDMGLSAEDLVQHTP